ncbi:MAG: hypothetical protein ACF8TS_09560 [Maioricimonas sp. JB049]
MERLAAHYLDMRPDPSLYSFLRHNFQTLSERHGGVLGLQFPIPKLLPLDDARSA